jgi:hypothetical protein
VAPLAANEHESVFKQQPFRLRRCKAWKLRQYSPRETL